MLFPHTLLPAVFGILSAWGALAGLSQTPLPSLRLSWPRASVVLGVHECVVGVGQCLWEKMLNSVQKGPFSSRPPCHMSELWHLCSLSGREKKNILLFLHTFQGLPSPEEVFMHILSGRGHPFLSSVHTRLYLAVGSVGVTV